uniref:Uncharacterized protein n=1 Tax=Schistosoma haematobium TaxID=6185 RepID=A0A095CEQ1_SCHHA
MDSNPLYWKNAIIEQLFYSTYAKNLNTSSERLFIGLIINDSRRLT